MTTHFIPQDKNKIPFSEIPEGSFFLRNKDEHLKIFPSMGKTAPFNAIHILKKSHTTKFNNVTMPSRTLVTLVPNKEVARLENAVTSMWTMIQKANQHLDGLIVQVQNAGGNPSMFLQLKKILTPIKRNQNNA